MVGGRPGNLARDEFQNLAAPVIDPKDPRRTGEPSSFEVVQKGVDRWSPWSDRAANRSSLPDDPAGQVSAVQSLLIAHGVQDASCLEAVSVSPAFMRTVIGGDSGGGGGTANEYALGDGGRERSVAMEEAGLYKGLIAEHRLRVDIEQVPLVRASRAVKPN